MAGNSAVAYDAGDGQVVLFGGICASCGGRRGALHLDLGRELGPPRLHGGGADAGRGTVRPRLALIEVLPEGAGTFQVRVEGWSSR